MRVLIIDGYVDEPACLGVPPYMSPYPRYIAGALVEKGIHKKEISYRTIDRIRTRREPLRFDLIVIIAGMTVPGKYLRSKPITLKEIKELSHLEGTKIIGGPFRLGRQPDLFMYRSRNGVPDPDAIEELYSGIRIAAPDLRVLHMDNANPVTISKYPDESRRIAEIIVKYHSSGDVAALGMESADPDVIGANDLKATPDEVFDAIKLLNEVGAARGANGLPELLPGINFVHGLKGETKRTFDLNFEFLKKVLDNGLMVRRVNIRQVMTFAGTPMQGHDELVKKNKALFLRYKDRIREEIDLPMLRRVVPAGTLLKDVRTEIFDKISFGRQLATYPLLVGIPMKLESGRSFDILVTGHGHRSITGLPVPIDLNSLPTKVLSDIPGIDNKQAAEVMRGRPFRDKEDIMKRTSIRGWILDHIM